VLQSVATPKSLTTMQPFFRELAVNRETALALFEGLDASQLAWRPSATRWGLADIGGHLATTASLYLPALDAAIRAGHDAAAYSDRAFRGSMVSRAVVWNMEPPVRLRMRAPKAFLPPADLGPVEARHRYLASQQLLELRLERAAGLDLTHVRVTLPTIRVARSALGSVLAMLLAHERRHLWQATEVRNATGFPAMAG